MNKTQLVAQTTPQTIQWLENNSFTNPQHLPNSYRFPVFIVDLKSKTIFGTNTTCMAAATSSGNKPVVLNFEQLKTKLSNR